MMVRRFRFLLCIAISLIPIVLVLWTVATYSPPFPFDDQWMDSVPIALKASTGSLVPGDLLRMSPGGHRIFFTHLHTVILTWLWNWPVGGEAFVNPLLAAVNLGLLLALLRKQFPGLVLAAMIPFSFLMFAIYQRITWVMSWQSGWHFVNLFLIGAVFVLVAKKPGWKPMLAAALLAACAGISRSHGNLVWLVVPVAMWMRGYRRILQYAAWAGLATAAILAYSLETGIGVAESSITPWRNLSVGDPVRILNMVLGQLGAQMGVFDYRIASLVGAAAVLLFGFNMIHLRRHGIWTWEGQAPWLSLAIFSAAGSAVICAARVEVMGEKDVALWQGYAVSSALFWVALAALAVVSSAAILRDRQRSTSRAVLCGCNLLFAVLVSPLYVMTQAEQHRRFSNELEYRAGIGSERIRRTAECLRRFPLTRDRSCLDVAILSYVGPGAEGIYLLAAYRLTLFSDEVPVSALPPSYAGSPVLVVTHSPWLNVYVREQMLADLPGKSCFLVSRTAARLALQQPWLPGQWAGFPEPLAERLRDEERPLSVWTISAPEAGAATKRIFARLKQLGLEPAELQLEDPRYTGARFRLHRFSRAKDSRSPG